MVKLPVSVSVLRVAFDGLDVDAQEGAVGGDLVLEALVDQGLLDGASGVLCDLIEQGDACGVVVRAGGENGDGNDQAQHVHGQSPLTARHSFPGVPAGRGGGDPGGRVDTLGVQHHQGRAL
jgi:GTPase involved in cell partitioning and DNA repair